VKPFVFFLLFFATCFASDPLVLKLKGHLGKEELEGAKEALAQNPKNLSLIVNSNSGNLLLSLEFAKQIYALKVEQKTKVQVYIEDSALGPAAIFPFLADTLLTSYNVAWGDISLGSKDEIPVNILKNRVQSLILDTQPNAKQLYALADGMTDPDVEIANLKTKGSTLVLNQKQLEAMGLAKVAIQTEFEQKAVSFGKKEESLEEKLKKHILFQPKGPNTVGRIYIGDHESMISQATWIYVKNALDYFKQNKPAFIILELDTPGGEVFAAQKISDALKEMDTQFGIPCVAVINNWALSAGAMLAYSCRFIAVVKDGSMGAAEPVVMGEGGQMTAASEKINSALRADFANRASFFGRNPDIAEAMVDKDVILVLRYGKVVKLDSKEEMITKGPDRDIIVSSAGKLLTLSAADLMKYQVADIFLAPEKLEAITEQEKVAEKWPASKTLLFQQPFFKQIPEAEIISWKMDWKTQLFSLLAHPMVSSLLFLAMMLGFYVEINTPGFGLPGSIGLIALFLIVLSSFALDVANVLEVILLLVGLAFIAIDLFLIPTFGFLGVVGIVLALIGLFSLMLPGINTLDFDFDTNTFNAAGDVFLQRLAYLSVTFVIGTLIIAFLARYVMPAFSPFSRFVLRGSEQEGFIAGAAVSALPQIGAVGEAATTLRPAGKVLIDDTLFDAVSRGNFIDKGAPIEVVALDGSVIVVDTRGKS
jgi:membrane-bound ClpP family serine protease